MKGRFKRLLGNWLIHSIIICILINLFTLISYLYRVKTGGNYLYYTDGSPVTAWQYFLNHNYYQHDMLVVVVFVFLAEFNYRYVFQRFRLPLFGLSCLLAGIISFAVLALLHPERLLTSGLLPATEPVLIMGGYAFIYALIRDYFYQLQYKKEVLLQQSENELNALKAQLNPHFLFNSLNYLYGTALKEKAPMSAEGIDRLSEMMRYTISGIHENFVPVSKELAFVKHYIALQQARFPKRDMIRTVIQMHSTEQEPGIAPLLLLPFIENAFKYGISIDKPSPINIKIDITGNHLKMEVCNRIIKEHAEVKGNNTGIKNTLKRLNLLYPDRHKLECIDSGMDYQVSLSIRLN